MSSIDTTIYVDRVTLVERRSNNYSSDLEIEVEGLDTDSMLSDIGIDEAVDYFGSDELLEKIGEEKALEYFNIEEKE